MKLFIALACLAIMGVFNGIFGNSLTWYKESMTKDVVTPYVAAYEALQKRIINPLLNANITQLNDDSAGNTTLSNLVRELNCGANSMRTKLAEALSKSNVIGQRVDAEVLATVSSISAKEQEISQKRMAITSLDTQINQIQGQVSSAEHAVRDKEGGVDAAHRDVQAAENAVNKARECRGKRFAGFFKKIIVRPFCSVFNSGGINRAKDRRGNAERQLHSARQQLESFRHQLNDLRNQQTNLHNQLAEANTQVSSLSTTMNKMREQQTMITSINAELRQVISHLSTFFSTTTVLQKVIERLIDFELLIAPLNTIYNGMNRNGLFAGTTDSIKAMLISPETITKIRTDLDQLTVKLSSMPFNTDGTQAC